MATYHTSIICAACTASPLVADAFGIYQAKKASLDAYKDTNWPGDDDLAFEDLHIAKANAYLVLTDAIAHAAGEQLSALDI
jgi:hypothetical protein